MRMRFRPLVLMGMLLPVFSHVHAQTAAYPSRPVTLIVPSAPGGNPDVAARIIANRLTQRLGTPFVVENRPGASGSIGTAIAAKAVPDGYTIAMLESNQLSINTHIYPKLSYTVTKDFVPIVEAVVVPTVLAVNVALPVKSLGEFIDYAKSQPTALNYGSSGSGSVHHLTMVAFLKAAGIKLTHIPYKGSAQTVPALVAGDIQAAFVGIPNIRGMAAEGRVKLLALSASERSGAIPAVPTVRELGFADFDMVARLGFFAPTGVPNEVKARLFAEVKKVLAEPDAQKKLEGLGMSVSKLDSAQFAAALDREYSTVGGMVRELDIKVE